MKTKLPNNQRAIPTLVILGLTIIATSIFLITIQTRGERPLVPPVYAQDVNCISNSLAQYVAEVFSDPRLNITPHTQNHYQNIYFLSPVFNMTNANFVNFANNFFAQLNNQGYGIGNFYAVAGNAYNTSWGNITDFISTARNDTVIGYHRIILTEIGWYPHETDNRSQAIDDLGTEIRNFDSNVLGGLIFDQFGLNPEFRAQTMTDFELEQLENACGASLKSQGVGANSAVFYSSSNSNFYDPAAGLPGSGYSHPLQYTLEIANIDLASVLPGINSAHDPQRNMIPIIRLGVGNSSGGFYPASELANFIQNLANATGDQPVYIVIGSNEPLTECWATPECECGSLPPGTPGHPGLYPLPLAEKEFCEGDVSPFLGGNYGNLTEDPDCPGRDIYPFLFHDYFGPPTGSTIPGLPPGPGPTRQGCDVCNAPIQSSLLVQIFNAAGNCFDVPASILAGIGHFEGWHGAGNPHLFNMTDDEIESGSLPDGPGDPYCITSSAGARGPMQFMPGAWSTYHSASVTAQNNGCLSSLPASLQRPPGYDASDLEKRCNIVDAIFAAAQKVAYDVTTYNDGSGCDTGRGALPDDQAASPPDPTNCEWEIGDAYHVGCHYYGNCTDNYCATLWNYYVNYSCYGASPSTPVPPNECTDPLPGYADEPGNNSPDGTTNVTLSFWATHPGEGCHTAIDLAAGEGTPVQSTIHGIVTRTGDHGSGYGNVVEVRNQRFAARYAHLNTVTVDVCDEVNIGDQVGTEGSTGYVTGPHVHYMLWDSGTLIDPDIYLDLGVGGYPERCVSWAGRVPAWCPGAPCE